VETSYKKGADMTNTKKRGRHILFAVALLMIASVVALAVFKRVRQEPKHRTPPTTHKAEQVTTPPQVISKVKDLEVAGVTILRQGTAQAAIAIDIVNKNDQPVVALELSAGDKDDFSDFGIDGLVNPLNPQVVIPPHSLKAIQWDLGAILEGYPVVITAATFGDGKDVGEARGIEMMHHDRKRTKAEREEAARKGAVPR
jgi:hypothetical protein